MHEMALMGEIVQVVWKDAEERNFTKISEIELKVGTLSQAMPEALEMAFLVYKEQYSTIFTDEAKLVIEIEEAIAKCTDCDFEYVPEYRITFCPKCGMPSGQLLKGENFKINTYEGE